MAVMDQPINDCCCQLLIGHEFSPFTEGKIGGHYQRLGFIAVGYHTEQELGILPAYLAVPSFIDDKHVKLLQFGQVRLLPRLGYCS